jgi:hypothetical protein
LTFWASAIATLKPANSSWSWTNRAPFIDPGRRGHRLIELHDLPGQAAQPIGIGRSGGDQQRLACLVHHVHV